MKISHWGCGFSSHCIDEPLTGLHQDVVLVQWNSVPWFRVVYGSGWDEMNFMGKMTMLWGIDNAHHWAAKVRILTTSKWHFESADVIVPPHYSLIVTLTSKWAWSLVTSQRKAAYQMPDCILISNRFVLIFHRCVAASELSNSLNLKSPSSVSVFLYFSASLLCWRKPMKRRTY